MLRRSLAHSSGFGVTDAEGECPEPDILAAYHERSLDAQETSRFDLHFSTCPRCRKQLAVMARASELLVTEEQKWRHKALSARFWDWRWLAPAAAVLVFTALWAARRPARPPLVAMSQPAESRTGDVSPHPNVAAASPSVMNALASHIAPNLPLDKAPHALSRQSPGITDAGNNDVAKNLRANSREEEESKLLANSTHAVANDALSKTPTDAPQSASSSPAGAAATAPPEPAEGAAGAAVGGDVNNSTAQLETDATTDNLRAKQMGVPAKASRYAPENKRSTGILIRTPDPQNLWRIRGAGFVERSTDGGASWHEQLSNPNAHIVAGSAPAAQICWIVGNSGMILLTQDGTAWTRISPPLTADFIQVAAKDASSATVTAADGRKFTTVDGGKHWSPVP
jgi:hypothetical protein